MKEIKERLIRFIKWILEECKDWKTLVVFICVVIIMYFPTWGGYLFYGMFKWSWALVMATTSLVFWAGPFTPFFPLCIAITLFIKKITKGSKSKKYN